MKVLTKENYDKAMPYLAEVNINSLFARTVVEHKIKGEIYVDNVENPKTFYIIHPYGMTLLLGESKNEKFNKSFKDYVLSVNKKRSNDEWMQAFPDSWHIELEKLFGSDLITSIKTTHDHEQQKVEINTRVNFIFDRNVYISKRKINSSLDINIVRTNKQILNTINGSVVPEYFWENENDFLENGVGFSLFYKGKLAATAFSSFIQDNKLELGIETITEFRGMGVAEQVCIALIDYCLDNQLEPIWACRLGNVGSYKLAKKLGFEPSIMVPYYRLKS
jgi:hypothetical protein